jgi:hypothetical protein
MKFEANIAPPPFPKEEQLMNCVAVIRSKDPTELIAPPRSRLLLS